MHRGFQRAWHDVEVDVLQAAQEVIDKASVTKEEFEVYVTGMISFPSPNGSYDYMSSLLPLARHPESTTFQWESNAFCSGVAVSVWVQFVLS